MLHDGIGVRVFDDEGESLPVSIEEFMTCCNDAFFCDTFPESLCT